MLCVVAVCDVIHSRFSAGATGAHPVRQCDGEHSHSSGSISCFSSSDTPMKKLASGAKVPSQV